QVAEGFTGAKAPERVNRRCLLTKALAAIKKSGTALMEETNKLIPPRIARAPAHDVNAAKQAERLVDTERVRSQVDSGEPVIFSGKGAGLYSAPLPDLPPLRP